MDMSRVATTMGYVIYPALVLLPLTSHFLLAFRFHITQLMLVVYTEFKLVPLNGVQVRVL